MPSGKRGLAQVVTAEAKKKRGAPKSRDAPGQKQAPPEQGNNSDDSLLETRSILNVAKQFGFNSCFLRLIRQEADLQQLRLRFGQLSTKGCPLTKTRGYPLTRKPASRAPTHGTSRTDWSRGHIPPSFPCLPKDHWLNNSRRRSGARTLGWGGRLWRLRSVLCGAAPVSDEVEHNL
jgi:hypothetical protein